MIGLLLVGLALASPSPAPRVHPTGLIHHTGVWSHHRIQWTTTAALDGAGGRIDLVAPIPGPVEVSSGGDPIVEGTEVVALDVPPGVREVTLSCTQTREDGLFPPLFRGTAVQRVEISGADWTPAAALGFETRLTRTTQPGLDARACRDSPAGIGPPPVCLVVDDRVLDAGGLIGALRPRGEASWGVTVGAAGIFAGLVGALMVAHRWLTRRGASERLDAYAREEFLR